MQGDKELLDLLAEDKSDMKAAGMAENVELRTPAERLFASVEGSNWTVFGNEKAPAIYVVVDSRCPHCRSFMNDIKKHYIDTGKLQVRVIPIGNTEETVAQAAFLLAAPDAMDRWYRHAAGDDTALPAKQEMNTQAIQMNLGLMQAWKFDVTPITFYRNSKGDIKIVRGRPNDIHAIYADLTG
jgi:thiol:disulfide interchange protein DsbG